MYKVVFVLIFSLISCDSKAPVQAKTPPVVKKEQAKPKLVEQSFKKGMEILCGSIDEVDASDAIKLSGYLDKHLTNTQLLSEYESMSAMPVASKKDVLDKLVAQARLSKCAYQSHLNSEIEKAQAMVKKVIPFEDAYVGEHFLRVNRVNDSLTKGKATIRREGGILILDANVEKGPYRLKVSGTVVPVSEREFILEGELKGVPDLSWMNAPPRERITKGSFLFKATKKRKFWRLYKVNGKTCACGETCGNKFCYIDVSFSTD